MDEWPGHAVNALVAIDGYKGCSIALSCDSVCFNQRNKLLKSIFACCSLQSRLSPFAHSKRRKKGKGASSKPSITRNENLGKWFSLIDASTLSKKKDLLTVKKLQSSLLLNKELHNTLYGLIVFEVSWSHVRGINYLNELQVPVLSLFFCPINYLWVVGSSLKLLMLQGSPVRADWYLTCFGDQIDAKMGIRQHRSCCKLYDIMVLWDSIWAAAIEVLPGFYNWFVSALIYAFLCCIHC